MSLANLLKDTVSLLKKTGERVDSIKASVQSTKISILRGDILIEPGDLLTRKMSNGGEETFEVIDPGFHEALHGIPAGYSAKVNKLGLPEARSAVQNITINVSGRNARVNQNSIDQSINYADNQNDEAMKQLLAIRDELAKLSLDAENRQEAEEVVDEIESQIRSGTAKRTTIKALVAALPNMGNMASIGSFLLQCFAK